MKQKKNRVLWIIMGILLVIIILLIGIMASLYFFTDVFKSNKQLFVKYMAQLVQNEDGYINDNVIQYFNKKQNESYQNEGNITFNVDLPIPKQQIELANNLNIHFSGKMDKTNVKEERQISLNYTDDVSFPLTYRKTNTIMGIQTQYLGSSFVAIRSDKKLSEFEKLNEWAQIQNLAISYEEMQRLKTRYIDTILNALDNHHFSKITEGEFVGYKLTLTGEEFKNILVQTLEQLKTDENTINKMNTIFSIFAKSIQLDTNYIDELIQTIHNELDFNNLIEIIVYSNQKKLHKMDIAIEGNTLTLYKEEKEQEFIYHTDFHKADNTVNIAVKAQYLGLTTDNVTENFEITIKEPYEENNQNQNIQENTVSKETMGNYQYMIINQVQFVADVNIEELTENNAVILNDKDEKYVTNLMNVIEKRLADVNKVHTETLGVAEDKNPIQYIIPQLLQKQTTTQLDENTINTFNQKFELYKSTNTKGATVKGLLTTIQNNNETEKNYKIEEINVDGEEYEVTEQNITFLKSNINVDDVYRVEFEKDINTGLIYRAVINKR